MEDHFHEDQKEDQNEFVDYIGLPYVISKLIYEVKNED